MTPLLNIFHHLPFPELTLMHALQPKSMKSHKIIMQLKSMNSHKEILQRPKSMKSHKEISSGIEKKSVKYNKEIS
jgi:hypothetical protein